MPISPEAYDYVKNHWGFRVSWAVWAEDLDLPVGPPSKEQIAETSIFDRTINPKILEQCNPNVIFVALNCSNDIELDTFSNFHSVDGGIYKLRYALQNSPYSGGYMTDFFKDYSDSNGKRVLAHFKNKPIEVQKNVDILKDEMKKIGSVNPIIICLHRGLYDAKHLQNAFPSCKVVHITHYEGSPNDAQCYRLVIMKKLIDGLGCEPWADPLENGWTLISD